jgi:CMP-N,N'-diacetyllegionaminic acid synthase
MTFRQRQVLALVPARGGSKGVKRKNLRIVRGKPLIAYTLEAAQGSCLIDTVYVSSDDDEILSYSASLGVKTLKRDPVAATDQATATQVVDDFVKRLAPDQIDADPWVVYLQPTSPRRTSVHIDEAFQAMETHEGDMGMSVLELKQTPFKAFKRDSQGKLKSLFDETLANANRQTLPVAYYPNGAIYIFSVSEFIKRSRFPSDGSVPYVMNERESIDIDTEADLAKLEEA